MTKIGLIDWVVICGGEPTLQKDLLEFCKKIKDLWFLVKLDKYKIVLQKLETHAKIN